jgi:hypothetical protein
MHDSEYQSTGILNSETAPWTMDLALSKMCSVYQAHRPRRERNRLDMRRAAAGAHPPDHPLSHSAHLSILDRRLEPMQILKVVLAIQIQYHVHPLLHASDRAPSHARNIGKGQHTQTPP